MLNKLLESNYSVLIAGPTASGKSRLGLEIAAQINGCIINADSLQVYHDWTILTARPSKAEQALCPHRLYGHISLTQDYSVGHWLREVKAEISNAISMGQRPIIIGGTGLYFQALTKGLSNIPDIPAKIRTKANKLSAEHGLHVFARALSQEDPLTYSKIDILNPVRTQRAWEVLYATGQGLAKWQEQTPPAILPIEKTIALHLTSDTDWLNARIDQRFEKMLKQGALEECRQIIQTGWDPKLPSCQAIGAAELISYINGEITLDIALQIATKKTRQYAKRQRTWFRSRMKDWHQIKRQETSWILT